MKKFYKNTIFHLRDFTCLNGSEFVQTVYRGVLKREPDPDGYTHFLDALLNGTLTKTQLIGKIRYSREGRQKKVAIKGLLRPFILDSISEIPVLGYPFSFVRNLLLFPSHVRELQKLKNNLSHLQPIFYREVSQEIPDPVYYHLMDEFRGSSRDILENLKHYLPLAQRALDLGGLVLDMGSGRGEWLTLLRQHNIPARGLDSRQVMVNDCLLRGLDVVQADALEYLEEADHESIPMVTGFHVMEHLSFHVLVKLWQESYRVLKPGGIIIFETPNPENLQVSSYYFYLDPTHKKLIPPPLAAQTLKALGFTDIEIIRAREIKKKLWDDPELNRFFCTAMDYAVVAIKPRAWTRPENDPDARAQQPEVLKNGEDSRETVIHGPFTGSYSLAQVNREMGMALEELRPGTVALDNENRPSWKPGNNTDYLQNHPRVDQLQKRSRHISRPGVVLYNSYPPQFRRVDGALNLTCAYGWEESRFPTEYVRGFNENLDGLTLMSNYVLKTMQDNGISLPMRAVGLGVDHIRKISPGSCPRYLGRGFRFLHVSSCFPRKGLDVLLKAYAKAFSNEDQVCLVIKTFPNPHNNAQAMIQDFAKKSEAPDVVLINEDLSDSHLLDIYKKSHCLVAPSRGEGFGLPMAEAMALNIPVITTGFGGQTDFCTNETSWLIDYSFAWARTHLNRFGSVWVEPDSDHLASLMREIFMAGQDEIRSRTDLAHGLIMSGFTWRDCAARLDKFIAELDVKDHKTHVRTGIVTSWNCRCGISEYSRQLKTGLDTTLEVMVLAGHATERTARDEDFVERVWKSSDFHESIPEAVVRNRLECVIINFHPAFFSLTSLGRLLENLFTLNVRVLIVFHSTENRENQLTRSRDLLQRVDRLLVHGINDLNLFKQIGLTENVSFFPHGVFVPDVQADKVSVDLPSGFESGIIIACFGFLMPHKGVLELIHAFADLSGDLPQARLLLLNSIYPGDKNLDYYHRCVQATKELGLDQRTYFFPDFLELEEVMFLLKKAALIVYPYQHTFESSSAAVRTGLAADVPVACTPLPIFDDVSEVVHFLPGSGPGDLAGGINKLLSDQDLLKSLDKVRKEWLSVYSWSDIGGRLSGLIRALSRNQ